MSPKRSQVRSIITSKNVVFRLSIEAFFDEEGVPRSLDGSPKSHNLIFVTISLVLDFVGPFFLFGDFVLDNLL